MSLLLLSTWLATADAAADAAAVPAGEAPVVVDQLVVSGNRRTRRSTFEALLPRPLPAPMAADQLEELERRIRNLGIFDAVAVARRGGIVAVEVREKWTLVPSLELASGETLADSEIAFGLTESNVLGTGHTVRLEAGWADRGPFAGVELDQHTYAPRSWAHYGELRFESAELSPGAGEAGSGSSAGPPAPAAPGIWQRRRLEAAYFLSPGDSYERPFGLGLGPLAAHEWLQMERAPLSAEEEVPTASSWAGLSAGIWLDRLVWDDLTPRGASLELWLSGALRVDEGRAGGRARGEVALALLAGWPLATGIGLVASAAAEAVNACDPNHSLTLDSQRGVRGLPDGRYWNRAQAFANLELRAAARLAPRWALQGVLFGDVAAFQPLDERGATGAPAEAAALGAGLRLVPTWLDDLLLRLDGARLLAPEPRWSLQLGAAQYF